jgi:hypothetical protein
MNYERSIVASLPFATRRKCQEYQLRIRDRLVAKRYARYALKTIEYLNLPQDLCASKGGQVLFTKDFNKWFDTFGDTIEHHLPLESS